MRFPISLPKTCNYICKFVFKNKLWGFNEIVNTDVMGNSAEESVLFTSF